MDKIKKVYVDSRYRTADSNSDSDFKFELKEALDLPDNTVCYVDDISIPHAWYTIEEDYNNRLYIEHENYSSSWGYDFIVFKIPSGNYTGASLASALQTELRKKYATFSCVYNATKGTITFTADYDFILASDNLAMSVQEMGGVWTDLEGNPISLTGDNLYSINGVIRLFRDIPLMAIDTTFETEFLDLLNTHNIYMHCPNLGHYNCIGVRGENSIIKKVPVSSSFGYLILDSVVAPHDKIDVSRQSIKTMHFTLKNVHGNVINLHGSPVSFSLIFQTIE